MTALQNEIALCYTYDPYHRMHRLHFLAVIHSLSFCASLINSSRDGDLILESSI